MRDVVWSIDAGADTVGALLDRLRDHFDQSADAAGLLTRLDVSGLPDATPWLRSCASTSTCWPKKPLPTPCATPTPPPKSGWRCAMLD